jgi:radical SAM superfamily enzyme YgiQ (UPF0313 family)
MRFAFIDPSYYYKGELIRLKRVGYPALTLPALAALVPLEHEVFLYYEKCEPLPLEEDFDLVFFATMGCNLVRAEEISAHFRGRGIPTAVGGWTTFPYAERCQEHFDVVVLGEGEGVVEEILVDLAAGSLKPCYENYHPDLSLVPVPRYELVNPKVRGPIIPVESSRGCANNCSFCAVSAFTKRSFRAIPVSRVLANIDHAREVYGQDFFYFTDPNFGSDRAHSLALMQALVSRKIHWLASVDIRVTEDEEFLDLARESGCFTLQVGFESVDPKNLEASHKGFVARYDYGEAVTRALDHGIPLTALMMVGFDSDTEATFPAILEFLETNHIPLVVLHVMTPIPRTALYQRIVSEGRLLREPLEEGDGLQLFIQPKHMSVERFEACFQELLQQAFSLRSLFKRYFYRGFFKAVRSHIILLLTNLFSTRRALARGYPPGMYE